MGSSDPGGLPRYWLVILLVPLRSQPEGTRISDNRYDIDMDAAVALKKARSQARLSQRALARRAGMAQPAIARIESGRVEPGVETLAQLLAACGVALTTAPRTGEGIDRTVMRQLLKLTPRERLDLAVTEATNLDRLLGAKR